MPNVQPYKIFPLDENTSIFVTDNDITYFIEFFSYSYMFPPKTKLGNIYTFNFYCAAVQVNDFLGYGKS